ncbi:MAG: zinc metalloprotease, partial [Anaerovoracaceae bacterium]
AREMVTKYGFSEKLGNVNYGGDGEVFLGNDFTQHKNYSEETAKEIDEEIRRFVGDAYERALSILREKDEILENVAQALLMVETINGDQFEDLYTGKISPEDLKVSVDKAGEEKKAKDAEESAERERLRAEEQARLMEELKKYDGDYLGEDDPSGPENPEETGSGEKEKEGEDESNS